MRDRVEVITTLLSKDGQLCLEHTRKYSTGLKPHKIREILNHQPHSRIHAL